MDPLSVNPISPAALAALTTLRPVQAAGTVPTQSSTLLGLPATSVQGLAQTLFQRTLQASTLFPVAEPTTGTAGWLQDVTASLLASMTKAEATVETAAVPATATSPAAVQPTDNTAASTTPPSAPPVTALPDQPANQDAFATSMSPDFAAQTALRFGAGVAAQAALAVSASDLGTELVRDATRVLRTDGLQTRSGGPGPDAFGQTQTAIQRILRTYDTAPAFSFPQSSSAVDLLA
jgi:hypothetical protein